jgi:hypothetical protein
LKLFNVDSVAGRNIFDQACQTYSTFDQDDKDLISQCCQVNLFPFLNIKFMFYLSAETLFYGD